MANNMAVMVRRLRQFIVDEKTLISRENQTLAATEKKPVPESLLDLMITDIVTQEDIKVGDFLADGPHDAVDVTILRKLMASMEEFLMN